MLLISRLRETADACVVGSGPNGLSAAIVLARMGLAVEVIEAAEATGGGARSAELTLPGFIHDVCSAVHPLAVASPFLSTLPLGDFGLKWVYPPAALAHPLDDGPPALLFASIFETTQSLGIGGASYRSLVEPFVHAWPDLCEEILRPIHLPRHPLLLTRFALRGLRSARSLIRSLSGNRSKALFAGLAAHSALPLGRAPSAAFGLVLAVLAHVAGWPFPQGGAQRISEALTSLLESLGGRVTLNQRIRSIEQLSESLPVLLDLTPRQVLDVASSRLSARYRRRLARYRYGPAAFKLDWALSEPIPWKDPDCKLAGTLHLGGTHEQIDEAEDIVGNGGHPQRPFVLLAQQSLFDSSRAPRDRHCGWAYTHVPNGSNVDMTEAMEAQVERFAPGFRQTILKRHKTFPADLEKRNPNCVGGDFNGGGQDIWQFLTRPVASLDPYRTSHPSLFLCSSSTPPGGGVHGLCGFHAAQSVLRRRF